MIRILYNRFSKEPEEYLTVRKRKPLPPHTFAQGDVGCNLMDYDQWPRDCSSTFVLFFSVNDNCMCCWKETLVEHGLKMPNESPVGYSAQSR
jgi:hypothetical protein